MQIAAKSVSFRLDIARDSNKTKASAEHLNTLFDSWLYVTNPTLFSEVQRKRMTKEEEKSYIDIKDIAADDMKPLIEKMKRLAAMERSKAKG